MANKPLKKKCYRDKKQYRGKKSVSGTIEIFRAVQYKAELLWKCGLKCYLHTSDPPRLRSSDKHIIGTNMFCLL